MLSKSQIKLITSLGKKKYRNHHKLFMVEGVKSIKEFLQSNVELNQLFTTDITLFDVDVSKTVLINHSELKKISSLTTPNNAVAIFNIQPPKSIDLNKLVVALDNVNDPGNLGTIIRLCDWFGVNDLICSFGTVDCYNPKVVQATMGSLARVNITYLDLSNFLHENKVSHVYGTFMEGENVYTSPITEKGILVLGNEANGISKEIEPLITKRLTIPKFGSLKKTESLNVATATAIFLSEFKRRTTEK